jgi:hypothetical protein
MAVDERTLAAIRAAVRQQALDTPGLWGWAPTDHELQIMISRNCMGEGQWDFYPAYSSPPRYVSRARVLELCGLAEQGRLNEAQRRELRAQRDDLIQGVKHWVAKHAAARTKELELDHLVDDIAMRAFAGHYDTLV